jgi:alkylated DNA repair dioxygenase AlkB
MMRPMAASHRQPPQGWTYDTDFLTVAQEDALLADIRTLPFQAAQYRQWQARRRIVSFGGSYDFSQRELRTAPPLPEFLNPLRLRVERWSGIRAAALTHATIIEYAPGTPLGWHRDVPQFEEIVGVSLLGHARMRFRPYPPEAGQRAVLAIDLAPRSIYVMRDSVRWKWQHAVSATKELRYAITFRTRRAH